MKQWNSRNLLKSIIGAILLPIRSGIRASPRPLPPEPFDTVAFTTLPVVADDDAFTIYEQLTTLFLPPPDESSWFGFADSYHWADASEKLRAGLMSNRPALELWRTGTSKNEAFSRLPGHYYFGEERVSRSILRDVARFAIYEASRLESNGSFATAWDWHNAVLRFGRQIGRHGMLIESLTGIAISSSALSSAKEWVERPEVDLTMLRKAQTDVAKLEELVGLPSDMIKSEYLYTIRILDENSNDLPLTSQDMLDRTEGRPKSLSRRLREAIWPFVQIVKGEPERSKLLANELMPYFLEVCDNLDWIPEIDPNFTANPLAAKPPWKIPNELVERWRGADLFGVMFNVKSGVMTEAKHKVELRTFQKQIFDRISRLEEEAGR